MSPLETLQGIATYAVAVLAVGAFIASFVVVFWLGDRLQEWLRRR